MSHHRHAPRFARSLQTSAASGFIEWEELPSLARSLAANPSSESLIRPAGGPASPWQYTMPAGLEDVPISQPFRESLEGLESREVLDVDVFRHFFGPSARAR